MEIFNNSIKVNKDILEKAIMTERKLSIAVVCFPIFAYQELKKQLHIIDGYKFIFT